ncbi:RNA polymerase Rpc34 [Trametes sanguinea]|nr:RNA polymerase Rpc34 [Trametes sanguinea]
MSARRKLNVVERKLHQAALSKPEKVISQQEIDTLEPRPAERVAAINFLLGTGLFAVLSGKGSKLLYRAVAQDVLEVKKGLTEDETLVLDRIRAAGNQGIWTKHIKAQTQLHQTVVDKCLKSLTQKQLVKTVPDVRHPTRKIYMLVNVQPAVELTGGPWYTDKELDTEFIKLLSDVCLKIVQDRSTPKAIPGEGNRGRRLYPLSYSPYPTANQVLDSNPDQKGSIQSRKRSYAESSASEDEGPPRKRRRSGGARRDAKGKRRTWSPGRTDEDSEHSDSESSMPAGRKRRRGSASDGPTSHQSESEDDQPSRKRHRSLSRHDFGSDPSAFYALSDTGGHVVYRAVQEERVKLGLGQTPCVVCPTFDFCKSGGPVNPQECAYYDSWIAIDAAPVD